MRNEEENKRYWTWVMDGLEANMFWETNDNFDKRSSVTKRGGRPYLYSPREISDQVVTYFRNCIENYQPLTIAGLCLWLGITREGMRKMEKSSNKELGDMIKKGKQLVEFYYEWLAMTVPNPAFPIFVLKNMGYMGWDNKRNVKTKVSVEISDEEKTKMQERIDNFSE